MPQCEKELGRKWTMVQSAIKITTRKGSSYSKSTFKGIRFANREREEFVKKGFFNENEEWDPFGYRILAS